MEIKEKTKQRGLYRYIMATKALTTATKAIRRKLRRWRLTRRKREARILKSQR